MQTFTYFQGATIEFDYEARKLTRPSTPAQLADLANVASISWVATKLDANGEPTGSPISFALSGPREASVQTRQGRPYQQGATYTQTLSSSTTANMLGEYSVFETKQYTGGKTEKNLILKLLIRKSV